MKKKVAVILSGCGFKDGAEIHEVSYTLLALDQLEAEVACYAPNRLQINVTNHLTGASDSEGRNILTEAARIARGEIKALPALQVSNYDALVFPGGFGAALNLSDFALKGKNCTVQADVQDVVASFVKAKKAIAALCIAPATLARALQVLSVQATLTIGNDKDIAATLESFGHTHQDCSVDECVVDIKNKIVTTPAYMYDARKADIFQGINKAMHALLELA